MTVLPPIWAKQYKHTQQGRQLCKMTLDHGDNQTMQALPGERAEVSRQYLFECPLREQVPLDPGESLMGVVISLFNQTQLLSLLLVQAHCHRVLFLQALQSQNEQLGVVLIAERREGDGSELARLQPVHSRSICVQQEIVRYTIDWSSSSSRYDAQPVSTSHWRPCIQIAYKAIYDKLPLKLKQIYHTTGRQLHDDAAHCTHELTSNLHAA